MFLNRLNETEKTAFLELAHHIARSDNSLSQEEKDIIAKYCMEMQIDDIHFDEEKFDIYQTIGNINNKASQKVVFLELMAMIFADDFLHEEERIVIEKIQESFDLSASHVTLYTEWAKTMLSLYKQGDALLDI